MMSHHRQRPVPEALVAERRVALPPRKANPNGARLMAAIPLHLREQKNAFEPAAVDAMAAALELACSELRVFAGDLRTLEIFAMRIIDLARNGFIDPAALCDRVVEET